MKRIYPIILSLAFNFTLLAHPWKPSHYVIIDTDGGTDDMRAITMMLASPDVRVLAITASSGSLSANNVYIKVKSLLNSFWHEGVPVGINRDTGFKSPDFPVASNSVWGQEKEIDAGNSSDCIDLIKEILAVEKTNISFICFGGMSTVSRAVKEIPDFRQKVKEIIWSSDGTEDKNDFNYNIDRSAANKVLRGDIPVKCICGLDDIVFYNVPMIEAISKAGTIYSDRLIRFFNSDVSKNHRFSFSANDEMVPLYLHFPLLFLHDTIAGNYVISIDSLSVLREKTIKILSGETVIYCQIFKNIPSDPAFYSADVEPFVDEIIHKYGKDEWISGVIANELHRHLGVFAIIGVKMGIRAREYFNTGVDEFTTDSYAGSIPPLSCMNDGLQVSTGSTPGHGLLAIHNEEPIKPSAVFKYMNRKIRLTLKPQVFENIISELKRINFVYGLDSNIYWELVRKNAIKYWNELDRHEIFIIDLL